MFYWDLSFLVEWVGWAFCVLFGKNRFWLVWLINLFNRPQPRMKWLKKQLLMLRDFSSRNDYSQKLPRFNQKRLEKCSTEKGQLYQPKPVAVETVLIPIKHDLKFTLTFSLPRSQC